MTKKKSVGPHFHEAFNNFFNRFEKKLLIQSKLCSQTKHYFKVLSYFFKHIFITKNVPIECVQLYTERDDLKWYYFNA